MSVGPVILEVEGDEFVDSCRIAAIIWSGATVAGNEAKVVDRKTGAVFWPGRTDTTETYLGISVGRPGISAPNGFKLGKIDNGTVAVYLVEA